MRNTRLGDQSLNDNCVGIYKPYHTEGDVTSDFSVLGKVAVVSVMPGTSDGDIMKEINGKSKRVKGMQ